MIGKRWFSYLIVALVFLGIGMLSRGWVSSGSGAKSGETPAASAGKGPCPGGAEAAYWKAPMDPAYVRNEPGKSPMGMDLVPVCSDEGKSSDGGGIRIDPTTRQNIGVRTQEVTRRDLARKIRAVGRVGYDERLVEHVHTKFQGWVEKLYIEYEGERVKRGQPLLEIYSPELVSTQEELLVAARYRETTAKSPFADVREGGEALFNASKRRLELWDIPRRDIERLIRDKKVRNNLTLYAPTQGVVTHLMVREGMEVGPSNNLYTIADLSRVWVYADVYEYELPWIKVGQKGTVELSYLPGTTFEGKVTYVYPFLDPKTRTARVRIELPNPDIVLKPDMFANVTIETELLPGVVAVPEEAVIRSGKRNLVILDRGEGRFLPRDVELGLDSGDGWLEVKKGLEAGETIVVSSQFLIDSESNLREVAAKLLAGDTGNKPDPGMQEAKPGTGGHEGHVMPKEDPHAGHKMDGPDHKMDEMKPKTGGHEGHVMPKEDPHAGHKMDGPAHDAGHGEGA